MTLPTRTPPEQAGAETARREIMRLPWTKLDIENIDVFSGHVDRILDAFASAARVAARDECAADNAKYQSDLDKLSAALGDWQIVPGGFVEAVCYHIRAMKGGIAQLVLGNVVSLARGAELTGLTLEQMRQWAGSGQMERDAASIRALKAQP